MLKAHFLRQTLSQLRALIAAVCFLSPALNCSVYPQASTEQPVVVTAEEVPSAYGAPPGFSRSRFSNAVNAYVLPPGQFSSASFLKVRGSVTGHPIICSPKRSSSDCLIVLMWRPKRSSNDLMVVAVCRQ